MALGMGFGFLFSRHGDFEFVKLAGRWCSVIFSSPGVALLVLASGGCMGRL